MGRYFFTFLTDEEAPDLLGADAACIAELRSIATAEARAIAASAIKAGYLDLNHAVRVEDIAGREILTVKVGDALDVRFDRETPATRHHQDGMLAKA